MRFELFVNFDGDCEQALELYSKVFGSEASDIMRYSDAPETSGYTPADSDRNRIMFSSLKIGGVSVMFSDAPSDGGFVRGNNIIPTISSDSKDDITRMFNQLKEGGKVHMELMATFWTELFGMVEDKFGVIWQFSYSE